MKNLTLTDDELNKQSEYETKFTFYKKHTDPSMGEITLLKNTAGLVICYKEQIKNSKEHFAHAIMEARERLKMNHKYLLDMKDYSTKQKNDFCSTFYTIRTFFEYQMNNLQKEIKHRKDSGIDFSMIELTHLLYNISEAGAYLQDRGKAHSDIRPSSIAVMEEGKSYKLIDRPEPNTRPLESQLNYIFSGKEVYLTPQLYNALKKNNMKVNHNEYKSDVFSFGLCILEAGLKRGVGSIYSESSFNPTELQKLIDEFHRKYDDNPLLVTTVKKMLSIDEADRPDFKTIMNAIPPYNEIVEFFEGEDQYFDGGDDFTSSRYGEGDYAAHPQGGPPYNQFAPQPYGQPPVPPQPYGQPPVAAQPYGNPQGGPYQGVPQGPVDPHYYNQAAPVPPQNPAYNPYQSQPTGPAPQNRVPQNQQAPYGQPQQQGFAPHYGHQDPYNTQANAYGNLAAPQPAAPGYGAHNQFNPTISQQGYQPAPQPGQPGQGVHQQPAYGQPQGGPMYNPAPQQGGQMGGQLYGTPGMQPAPVSGPNAIRGPAYGQPAPAPGYNYGAQTGVQQPSVDGSDIKIIQGRRYREVKEERVELNERGTPIKKMIVKLEPLDDNVKKTDTPMTYSTQGTMSGTASQYSGYSGGYQHQQGAPGGFGGFAPR